MIASRLFPRISLRSSIPISKPLARLSSTTARSSDKIPANDPHPKAAVQNVSETNTLPLSKMGIEDGTLQESTETAEKLRVMQAPNRTGVWSRSQQPREKAMSGPRFEQTIMEYQVSFDRRDGAL